MLPAAPATNCVNFYKVILVKNSDVFWPSTGENEGNVYVCILSSDSAIRKQWLWQCLRWQRLQDAYL